MCGGGSAVRGKGVGRWGVMEIGSRARGGEEGLRACAEVEALYEANVPCCFTP